MSSAASQIPGATGCSRRESGWACLAAPERRSCAGQTANCALRAGTEDNKTSQWKGKYVWWRVNTSSRRPLRYFGWKIEFNSFTRGFRGGAVDHTQTWWSRLSDATKLRNQLTHSSEMLVMKQEAVERAIQAIVDTIDALYRAIYSLPFPAAARGVQSTLMF